MSNKMNKGFMAIVTGEGEDLRIIKTGRFPGRKAGGAGAPGEDLYRDFNRSVKTEEDFRTFTKGFWKEHFGSEPVFEEVYGDESCPTDFVDTAPWECLFLRNLTDEPYPLQALDGAIVIVMPGDGCLFCGSVLYRPENPDLSNWGGGILPAAVLPDEFRRAAEIRDASRMLGLGPLETAELVKNGKIPETVYEDAFGFGRSEIEDLCPDALSCFGDYIDIERFGEDCLFDLEREGKAFFLESGRIVLF